MSDGRNETPGFPNGAGQPPVGWPTGDYSEASPPGTETVNQADTVTLPASDWWEPPTGQQVHDDAMGQSLGQPKSRKDRKSLGAGKLLALAAAISLLAGGVGGAVGYSLADDQTSAISAPVATSGSPSAPADGSIAAVAQAVSPSVVTIAAGQGSGTGFVIRSDGYILTNNHVVDGQSTVDVTFDDGATAKAEVVGADAGYDLAVVKVDRTDLPVVTMGSSSAVHVGDTAIAIGSPLGLRGTVTSGIVSALDQPVTAGGSGETSFINAIQTDAAINPGNSGGPLVDGNGHVIGVNSAIASLGQSGGQVGSIGLGFAIPVDTAQRIADELINTGSTQTPVIGVQVDPDFGGNGAQVKDVTAGGPAQAAGLSAGDVIVAVDGKRVTDSTELIVLIRDKAVDQSVTLTLDGGQEIAVTLGAAG